jgi:hypothetical protein
MREGGHSSVAGSGPVQDWRLPEGELAKAYLETDYKTPSSVTTELKQHCNLFARLIFEKTNTFCPPPLITVPTCVCIDTGGCVLNRAIQVKHFGIIETFGDL